MTTSHTTPRFWNIAIIHGGLAGFFIISFMIGSYTLFGMQSSASSMAVGFLIMFLILSLIFFGIKRFRDGAQGGVIKFSKALGLGVAMSVFAGLVYVVIWEIYVRATGSLFIDHYTNHLIDLERAKDIGAAELAAFTEKMEAMKKKYANPFYRMPMTFTEIFPVGVVVTLVSALFLHNPKLWARAV